jgi:hypothetical protein
MRQKYLSFDLCNRQPWVIKKYTSNLLRNLIPAISTIEFAIHYLTSLITHLNFKLK